MNVTGIFDAIEKAQQATSTIFDYGPVQVISTNFVGICKSYVYRDYAYIKSLLEYLDTLDFLPFCVKVRPRKIWPRLLLVGDVVIGIGENVFGYILRDYEDKVRIIQKTPDDLHLPSHFKFVKKTLQPNSHRYDYISINQHRGRPMP